MLPNVMGIAWYLGAKRGSQRPDDERTEPEPPPVRVASDEESFEQKTLRAYLEWYKRGGPFGFR